jgi:CheY-like chemotaxis protein
MVETELQVLLVEDSSLLAERLLELIAQTEGVVTVASVATEAAAIQAVQEYHPDALILDLRLKEGTGFGVMRYLKTLPRPPTVVVLTNYALSQYRQQAELLGARHFLDKSQQFDQLPGILESLRQERRSQAS